MSSLKAWNDFHRLKGLQAKGSPPQVDAEKLLKRMIIPKEGGRLIPETFTALKKLKKNGVTTCGLTNNFVFIRQLALLTQRLSVRGLPISRSGISRHSYYRISTILLNLLLWEFVNRVRRYSSMH